MFHIKTYNKIAEAGLAYFQNNQYSLNTDQHPDAIICRSQNLHQEVIPTSTKVITRAGAGTNNIPTEQCTALGIPVLNTPGANANAVKELVITGMLLACRNICSAWQFTQNISIEADLNKVVEANKKQFAGFELPEKTLAVIGLGKIGVKVANAARQLGMHVTGFDPALTIQNAWELDGSVQQAHSIEEAIANADFISIHVPLLEKTTGLINTKILKSAKSQSILLNFSRGPIVDNQAILAALAENKLAQYVCDFPDAALQGHPKVIALPHLGASTKEAEENCATMAARQTIDFLTTGQITHSVNFPTIHLTKNGGHRVAIMNQNVPNMVAQISSVLSNAQLNIIDMLNKSRDAVACTLIDVDQPINDKVIQQLQAIEGVLRARAIHTIA